MRRTTRKEKQNLVCSRKNAQQQNQARPEPKNTEKQKLNMHQNKKKT